MSFSQENGYVPSSIETLMDLVRQGVNSSFGLSYTPETFVGTGWYKYFYVLIQKLQQNEVKTSEIFIKLQEYFNVTNEKISRPVVTNPGLIDKLLTEGFVASVKPMIEGDAGKIHVCVDVDDDDEDYAETKLAICTLIKDSTVAGAVTQGTESESIVLTNGQSFDFKYNLPYRIPVWLRLTVTLSENNQVVISSPDAQKALLLANIAAKYKLGKNFEPQKYFGIIDAPWASTVLLEWTDDVTDGELDMDATWHDELFDADYDELFDIALERVTLVEN